MEQAHQQLYMLTHKSCISLTFQVYLNMPKHTHTEQTLQQEGHHETEPIYLR